MKVKNLGCVMMVALSLLVGTACHAGQKEIKGVPDERPVLVPVAETADGFYQAALGCKAEKDWEGVVKNLRQAIEEDPKHVKAWAELAWILNETREFEKAVKASLSALKLDEECAPAWRELGYASLKLERYDEAKRALSKARELDPDDKSTLRYLSEPKLLGVGEEKTPPYKPEEPPTSY